MKYIYIENGIKKEIKPETWVWGVIYKPTEDQLQTAIAQKTARDEIARVERNTQLDKANKKGLLKRVEARVYERYNKAIQTPVRPEFDDLHQFGDDGIFHRVGEIDQDRIFIASLYKFGKMKERIDIPFRPGYKLIHKYVNVHVSARMKNLNETVRAYVFGYKFEGKEYLNYILPDGRIVMSPDQSVDLIAMGI
jgi:hypothetical protein